MGIADDEEMHRLIFSTSELPLTAKPSFPPLLEGNPFLPVYRLLPLTGRLQGADYCYCLIHRTLTAQATRYCRERVRQ